MVITSTATHPDEKDEHLSSTFASRYVRQPIPKFKMPDSSIPKDAAYQLINDELMLDGAPRLNLASFVTTWMEPECEKLIMASLNKNYVDMDEYPVTTELQNRCVNIIANLFHAPLSEEETAVGVGTVGSSEAIMLAGLAFKRKWQTKRKAEGKPYDKPNIVTGANVQVCWEKFARYFEVELKEVKLSEGYYVMDPVKAVEMVDENTICVAAILGSTMTGEFEDVKLLSELLTEKNKETGWDTPIHVDAASGGFIAPFLYPDLEWDFRLPLVKSINVSGHKYGLVYPGVGWVVWRSSDDLPDELVFHINYLGSDQPTFTLNFSKGSSQIIAQYYQFIRLGFEGYKNIMENCWDNARTLRKGIERTGRFDIISKDIGVPLVAFSLKDSSQHTVFEISDQLRRFGWIVPAYTMPPDAQHIAVLRVVVREDFNHGLAERLAADIDKVVKVLDTLPSPLTIKAAHVTAITSEPNDKVKKSAIETQREISVVSNRSPQNPMFPPRHYTTCLLLLFLVLSDLSISQSQSPSAAKRKRMKEKVRNMFYHAYDNYMTYAFPHDELKPLSKTFTNSLSELGNLKLEHLPQDYHGSALTLIESLSSLVIMGNSTEFERAVLWLSENLTFDVDARINLFECNIRVLGGLVSAHLLASDSSKKLFQGAYNNQLLVLAEDLGKRFLPAFNTPTALPYAWINLKYGVMENETTETSTSGCGSLILEMGALSKMTGDPIYESVALRALRKLWSMQSSLKLFGTTLDVATGQWIEYSSGIGAGVDSFYEYLLKAHILFGKEDFWKMFHSAYVAVQKYFRHGSWYHEADMRTGRATYWQLTSLQAFWPGLQVLIGDLSAANSSHREFFHVWKRYGVLPERYLLDHQMIHPTEKYYPLRPELAESTFYLYQATKDPWYMEVGESIVNSINLYTKVEGGFASIKDVTTMQLEDHQHSFFLAETCKYLYLLFDDSFVHENNYVFTTEGHPLPVLSNWHEELPQAYVPTNWTFVKRQPRVSRISSMSLQVCPALNLKSGQHIESACHIPDARSDFRCLTDEDCGVDATTCRRRSCSMAGYCGLWLIV